MTEYQPKFKDYFWSENDSFDIDYANLFHTEDKSILYLHGALHLVKSTLSGKTRKLKATSRNLLTQFGQSLNSGETPLFVAEGRPHDKLASIRSSDYLSFAYEQFANHEGNLVIFGHSLGDSDQHLINAMKHWVNRTIAVSMRPSANDPNRVIEYKARIKRQLPQAHIIFYNAETHPLGKQGLRITRDGDNNI